MNKKFNTSGHITDPNMTRQSLINGKELQAKEAVNLSKYLR